MGFSRWKDFEHIYTTVIQEADKDQIWSFSQQDEPLFQILLAIQPFFQLARLATFQFRISLRFLVPLCTLILLLGHLTSFLVSFMASSFIFLQSLYYPLTSAFPPSTASILLLLETGIEHPVFMTVVTQSLHYKFQKTGLRGSQSHLMNKTQYRQVKTAEVTQSETSMEQPKEEYLFKW